MRLAPQRCVRIRLRIQVRIRLLRIVRAHRALLVVGRHLRLVVPEARALLVRAGRHLGADPYRQY